MNTEYQLKNFFMWSKIVFNMKILLMMMMMMKELCMVLPMTLIELIQTPKTNTERLYFELQLLFFLSLSYAGFIITFIVEMAKRKH